MVLYNLNISQKQCQLIHKNILSHRPDYLPIKNHREFNSMVFTIDPPNSVDIEDGLSLEVLGDGY